MKTLLKFLLKLYFVIQCVFLLLHIWLFFSIAKLLLIILCLGGDYIRTFYDARPFLLIVVLILFLYLLYVCITVISIIATKDFIQEKLLTKLQKICIISFPIITIPIYIFMVKCMLIVSFIHL